MDELSYINEQMNMLSVPYEFGQWSSEVTYPYFFGEISEEPPTNEDGGEQKTFIITGFHRGTYSELIEVKEKIKKHFDPIYGLRASVNGDAIAVFYDGSFFIPTDEAQLKKIQINLKIKMWKGVS